MSLIYTGNVTFEETEKSGQLGVDLWGADTLTREYEGSKALLDGFLASFRITIAGFSARFGTPIVLDRSRQMQDRSFPDLYMTEFNVQPSRAFAKVTCTFKGVFNGRKPQPVIDYGTRTQQVTLPFIGDEAGVTNGISASFIYKAPFARYRYLAKRKPVRPLFQSKLEPTEGIQVVARTGAAGSLKFFKGRTITNRSSNLSSAPIGGDLNCYNAVVECIPDEFTVVPVGTWWEVTEVNQAILTPLDLATNGWAFQLANS